MKLERFELESDLQRFASDQGIRTRKSGDELFFQICPYCKRTERNNQNTFSVNLNTGMFKCFRASCQAKGNVITLARDFDFEFSSREANEYYRLGKSRRKFIRPANRHPEPKNFSLKFMKKRGISEAVATKYNITERSDRPGVIVFPFYDEDNVLQFIKYRNTEQEAIDKYGKEYCQKDCKPILFGMNHCDPANPTLVLTEGQMDSLSCTEAGIANAVSVPTGAGGFTWVPYCWDFLKRYKTLIVFGDHEKGHITLLDEMKQRFKGSLKHVREEDYLGHKDANEILLEEGPEAVRQAIEKAVLVDVPDIVDLANVPLPDPESKAQIPTGFNKLNRVIGGFFGGQLAVLTGKRGLGKSTLASQMVINAVNNGWNSFYYSGELSNANIREWLELQIAGSGKTTTYTINNKVFYKIQEEYSKAASDWYRGKIFTRAEPKYTDDEEEAERELVEVIEDSIIKYDCKFIVIDNLMTALVDNPNTDKYREQGIFMKRLTLLAMRYNVFILLVSHPRKNQGLKFTSDDVAGSGDITNLASVVLEYGRPDLEKGDPPDSNVKRRVLRIMKNRLTGDVNEKGIELYFDSTCKRISEHENDSEGQINVNLIVNNDSDWEEIDEEIPFD